MEKKPKSFSEAIDNVSRSLNGPAMDDIKSKLETEIHKLEDTLNDLKKRAQEEAGKVKDKVETQVQEHPWATLGIVGLIFLVLGLLLGWNSRGRRD